MRPLPPNGHAVRVRQTHFLEQSEKRRGLVSCTQGWHAAVETTRRFPSRPFVLLPAQSAQCFGMLAWQCFKDRLSVY